MKCEWLNAIDVSSLSGKNILIAGGSGFIGKRCVQVLKKTGCKMTVLTRNSVADDECVHYAKADLNDIESLQSVQSAGDFDYAIYMAAHIPLAGAKKETYLDAKNSTLDPFVHFCEIFLPKVKSFVYISSIDVMGACEKENYTEDEPIHNPSPYGLAKYCGEYYTKVICENLKIPYTILRFSQVYGPNEPVVRIIPILKRALLEGTEFNLYTHGDEKRKFLFIDDAVQAIIRACISKKSGIFTIAGKDSASMLELVSVMERTFDKKLDLHILRKVQGLSNQPSTLKAENVLGFEPNFTLRQLLRLNNPRKSCTLS